MSLFGCLLIYYILVVLVVCLEIEWVWVVLFLDDFYWVDYDWFEFGVKFEIVCCGGVMWVVSVMNGL